MSVVDPDVTTPTRLLVISPQLFQMAQGSAHAFRASNSNAPVVGIELRMQHVKDYLAEYQVLLTGDEASQAQQEKGLLDLRARAPMLQDAVCVKDERTDSFRVTLPYGLLENESNLTYNIEKLPPCYQPSLSFAPKEKKELKEEEMGFTLLCSIS